MDATVDATMDATVDATMDATVDATADATVDVVKSTVWFFYLEWLMTVYCVSVSWICL